MVRREGRGFVLVLLILVSMGFVLRGFAVSNFNFKVMDETGDMNAARNLLERGDMVFCSYNMEWEKSCNLRIKSHGYVFLLAMLLSVFGFSAVNVFWMNVFLGSLTVFLVGVLGTQLFDRRAGMFSALLAAVYSPHVVWSGTGEKTVSALFFAFVFLVCAVFLWREFDDGLMLFGLASYMFTGMIRPEFFLFFSPVMFLILKDSLEESKLFSELRLRFSAYVISVYLVLLAVCEVIFKLFKEGELSKTNIEFYSMRTFFSNVSFFLNMSLGKVFLGLILVCIIYFALRSTFERRSIIYYSGMAYLLSFLFFKYLNYRFIMFPMLIAFIFISGLLTDVFDDGCLWKFLTVFFAVWIVFVMVEDIREFNEGNVIRTQEYMDDLREEYGNCTVITKWIPYFEFYDEFTVVSKGSIEGRDNNLVKAVRENCTLIFGKKPSKLPGNVVYNVLESHKYSVYDYNLYNLSIKGTD